MAGADDLDPVVENEEGDRGADQVVPMVLGRAESMNCFLKELL